MTENECLKVLYQTKVVCYIDVRDQFFRFTPLGKADREVREHIGEAGGEYRERYRKALNRYRSVRIAQLFFKLLLYASIVTSIFVSLGLEEVKIIQQIASLIGTSVILVIYVFLSYLKMIRRENYLVQREILISRSPR